MAQLDLGAPAATAILALGFGATQAQAVGAAEGRSHQVRQREGPYEAGWQAYDAGLNAPPSKLPGWSRR